MTDAKRAICGWMIREFMALSPKYTTSELQPAYFPYQKITLIHLKLFWNSVIRGLAFSSDDFQQAVSTPGGPVIMILVPGAEVRGFDPGRDLTYKHASLRTRLFKFKANKTVFFNWKN